MLYLTLPLAIAGAAVLVVAVIVLRKLSYLRKLTPESHEVGDTVLHDFAPEAVDWFRGIPWRQYLQKVLAELEGLLARLRQAMFAMGKASDTVLKTVRKAGQQAGEAHEEAVAQLEEERVRKVEAAEHDLDEVDMDDPAELKSEEQRLIVAIAQNPRDAHLYSDLARVSMRLQSYGDAVEALEQASKLEPENDEFKKRLERARRRKESAVPAPSETAAS